MKFNILVPTNIFRWFPASPTYSHLGTVSSSHGLYSAWVYLLSTYRCGIRILSGMESCRVVQTTLQALFRCTVSGVVVQGFRSLSVPVTHEGHLVESRRPLWLNTLSRHSPLAAMSRSMSIISLRLGSSASFPHRFQVPVTLVHTVQPFCPASLVP